MFVDLRSQWEPTAAPSDTLRRQAVTAGIVASWSLAAALPLFASVTLQDHVDFPPTRTDPSQQIVHLHWIAPPWDTQYTRKLVQEGPAQVAPQVPFTPTNNLVVNLWPQPDWPTQVTIKTPIPDVHDSFFFTETSASPIVLWPQPDWPTQITRKTPASAVPITTNLMPHRPWLEVGRWSDVVIQPLWTTYGAQSSVPVVDNPPPTNNSIDLLVGTWPQPDWPTQYTEKTPIPNVPLVPFSRAAFQGIDRWDPLQWDTQITRKTPVPSQAEQVDNPPPRNITYPIYDRWFNAPTTSLWRSFGYFDGPTVGPSDAPPPRLPFPESLYGAWEPRQPEPVWGWRLITLPLQPSTNLEWLFTVCDAWTPPPPDQPRRRWVTPSGVLVINNPPFTSRRPNLSVIDTNWIPPTLPSQRAPLLVQPGVDPPPINTVLRRRSLDIIVRAWETIPDPPRRLTVRVPQGIVFRRTLSEYGTGVGFRQRHGWS